MSSGYTQLNSPVVDIPQCVATGNLFFEILVDLLQVFNKKNVIPTFQHSVMPSEPIDRQSEHQHNRKSLLGHLEWLQ